MKHTLQLVSIVLPLVFGAGVAMAFSHGVPPHSGPGSVYYGQPEKGGDHAVPTQKSLRKKSQQASGLRLRRAPPKQSQ